MTVPAAVYVVGEAETLTLMAEVGGVTLFDAADAAPVPSPLVACHREGVGVTAGQQVGAGEGAAVHLGVRPPCRCTSRPPLAGVVLSVAVTV